MSIKFSAPRPSPRSAVDATEIRTVTAAGQEIGAAYKLKVGGYEYVGDLGGVTAPSLTKLKDEIGELAIDQVRMEIIAESLSSRRG